MDHNKKFVEAIVDRMKKVIGVTRDKELADYLGGSKSGPAVWKVRGTIPFEECIALAQKHGVSLDWLILGRGDDTTGVPDAECDSPIYVELPVFDMATFSQRDISNLFTWRMPRAWLEQEGLDAAEAIVMRVVGDTMEGTIRDGQLVIIDRRPRDADGVYLVRFGGALRIKRMQRMVDGSVRLSNDNQVYAVDTIPGDDSNIEVIGYCHSTLSLVR